VKDGDQLSVISGQLLQIIAFPPLLVGPELLTTDR